MERRLWGREVIVKLRAGNRAGQQSTRSGHAPGKNTLGCPNDPDEKATGLNREIYENICCGGLIADIKTK